MGNAVSRVPDKHTVDPADRPILRQRKKNTDSRIEAPRKPVKPETLPTLQLSCNGAVVQELPLDVPRVLIGRSDDNDLSIPSRYVSRHHILLVRHRGSTILIDLNSTNGTFVNSDRVYNHVLANEDVITVDRKSMFVEYSITFSDPSATAHGKPGDPGSVDAIIKEALAETAKLLGKSDTDLLPALSENVPTEIGIIDDR